MGVWDGMMIAVMVVVDYCSVIGNPDPGVDGAQRPKHPGFTADLTGSEPGVRSAHLFKRPSFASFSV